MKRNILLTGGARSGKSSKAEELAKEIGGRVLFVATADAGDADMQYRITRHRNSRPASWDTIEASRQIGKRIMETKKEYDVIIVDCLTMLACNVVDSSVNQMGEDVSEEVVEGLLKNETDDLIQAIKALKSTFLIVTNEVGLGIVPDNRLSRLYRDALGRANQRVAESCDEVIFLISGCSWHVKGAPPLSKTGR